VVNCNHHSSLIPIESYVIFHHPIPVKIAVLLINVTIVAYLAFRAKNSDLS
jgi:uncharacterized membrane protein (DUF2068 family)